MPGKSMSKQSRPAYQNRIIYHAGLLAGFATLAAALLVMGNLMTQGPISERQAEDLRASLSQVISPGLHDNNLLDNKITVQHGSQKIVVFRAMKDGKVTAVAYRVYGYGYAGKIVIMMGIDSSGTILGVRVLSHSETPGLGDRIEAKKDDWIFSFNKLSLNNTPDAMWAVKKDGGRFDQFSGATITPRAVVKAVKSGLDLFHAHSKEMLTTAAAGGDKQDNQ
jgi:electron transport complex protein RnfG